MAGRRFFQRGHASVSAAYPTSGASRGLPRWVTGTAALAAVCGVLLAFSSCLPREDGGSLSATAMLPPPTASSSMSSGSLLDAALDRVQSASWLGTDKPSAGDERAPVLSGDALSRLAPTLGRAEARLIEIYQLIGQGDRRQALGLAEKLVQDHPNFQLAQLVYGDLLSLQTRPVRQLGDVPDTTARAGAQQLAILREESSRRLRALAERPPPGTVPAQFLALAPQSRHAIAIDASRSRLYLFENQSPSQAENGLSAAPRLKLLGDYYISVGMLGVEKSVEGDKRTPLGVYYITSTLDRENLPDLYGIGALPINYPNPLDMQRGKTGSGIWLHGTPRDQFVRAPQASDGCVVLSNPDLEKLLNTVQIRTTPVVIASELQWVDPGKLERERRSFEAQLAAWRDARNAGQLDRVRHFYSERMLGIGKDPSMAWPRIEAELRTKKTTKDMEIKDVSLLNWRDRDETMVVTFGEVPKGQTRGVSRRQYWLREHDQWKIIYEGTP